MKDVNQNVVQLVGKLVKVKKVWESIDYCVCEGIIQIIRDSGCIDSIPILFKENGIGVDSFISIKGQFRSRDISVNGKLKVELYVYVQEMLQVKDPLYVNNVYLTGYICKNPNIRNTPSGKQISDLLIACNYNKDKTAYIPAIAWGKHARKCGKYNVGTQIEIFGRL